MLRSSSSRSRIGKSMLVSYDTALSLNMSQHLISRWGTWTMLSGGSKLRVSNNENDHHHQLDYERRNNGLVEAVEGKSDEATDSHDSQEDGGGEKPHGLAGREATRPYTE